ncbi:MAG TPA: cytotoxic translational repressor of toxin-antitoxin stability system [Oceanipulchritudo sp.]|nr:cytotoxic translational repressor of toxin-antitoxin stability system [Oceanipulchritudo sp.]
MDPDNAQTLSRRARGLFQVTFSDHSMRELNKLPVENQLALVDKISNVTPAQLSSADESIGRFHRDGITYYRVRAGDFRCYFEIRGETLYAHFILHRNSLTDFIYRNRLPITEETMVEQHKSFWKYLETLKKNDPS